MKSERPGTFVVKFGEGSDGTIVGRIDGDPRPVLVSEKSIKARPGDVWECKLLVDEDSADKRCIATLLNKVKSAEAPVPDAAEAVPAEDVVSVAGEDEPEEEYEYVIHDYPEDRPAPRPRFRRPSRHAQSPSGIRFVPYMSVDDEEALVIYRGGGMLTSSLLMPSPYMAFLTPNRKFLQLIPCEKGDIPCNGVMIKIGFLEALMEGRKGCILDCDNDDGALTLHLR